MRQATTPLAALVLAGFAGAAPACRENISPPRGPVASLTVSPDTAELVRGDSVLLVVTARNSAGSVLSGVSLSWSSSDSAVAAVRSGGHVVGLAAGTATIGVAADGRSDTAFVRVVPRVTAIRVSPPVLVLVPGGVYPLTARDVDEDAGTVGDPREATWSSSDTAVAAVSAAGVVTSRSSGVAHVRAAREGHADSARVEVRLVAFSQVSAGPYSNTCATGPDGAFCWGQENFAGSLGTGARVEMLLTPTGVEGGGRFAFVSVGDAFACGLTAGGAAWCWGDGAYGRLGNGRTDTAVASPTSVAGPAFLSIGAGRWHACALSAAGEAHCWGANSYGALGVPTTTDAISAPELVQEGLTFVSIGAGFRHTCALAPNGTAYCWGRGYQLGDSACVSRHSAGPVAGATRFRALSVGLNHSCGLTADSVAYCWGYNDDGMAGAASPSILTTPTRVGGAPLFASVTAGYSSTCGLTATGAAYCWGLNRFGQLGTGDTLSGPAPRPVAGGLRFASVSSGKDHTCGLGVDGVLYCWGSAVLGMLGNGTQSGMATAPVRVSGQRASPTGAPRPR